MLNTGMDEIELLELMTEQARSMNRALDLVERLFGRNDDEHAEIRDGMIDLDHSKASKDSLEDLRSSHNGLVCDFLDLKREHAATRQVLNSLQEDGA